VSVAALAAVGVYFAAAGATSPAAADKGQLTYTIDATKGPVKVKAGDKGAVQVVLKPQGGSHVDPRAPLQLQAKAGSAVDLAKAQLGHADGKEADDKSLTFDVPFTGKVAGSDEIKVHADFYLCTAKLCERQIADVAVPVVVE
jgi:hypothetical protein